MQKKKTKNNMTTCIDVDTRDKHKPHYGMNNLNSRQEKEKEKFYYKIKKTRKKTTR